MAPTDLEIYREAQWRLCERDPLYFLEKYWTVETISAGYGPFKMFPYQLEDGAALKDAIANKAPQRQVRLKARQIGWTTLAAGFAFHSAWFAPSRPWLIASQGEMEASKTLQRRAKLPYANLPAWMRERGPQVTTNTNEVFAFNNGSELMAIPATSSAGRSQSVFGVLMDEAAFVENADELFAALDPLCYGPLFVFSTANGMGNFFHEIWQEAQLADSEWVSAFRPWSARPNRDDEWYRTTKRRYRGREHLFFQEYPSSPEEAFSKSGNTALNMDRIRELHYCVPEARYDLSLLDVQSTDYEAVLQRMLIPASEERDLELHVWQAPYLLRDEDNHLLQQPNFVVSVDTSEGLSDGDFSAIAVWDANTFEVVATMKAQVPIEDLGAISAWLGYWYYVALVGVERNNMGLVPLQYLSQVHYPRLYRMDTIAQQKRGDRTTRYGWHTNKATKPKMVVDFNKELRAEVLLIHDQRFLHEAGTFLADGKGGYGASPGNHDDLIAATLIGLQLVNDVGQYPLIWHDPAPGPLTMGDVIRLGLRKDEQEIDPLGVPIGQHGFHEGARRSFWVDTPT